MAWEGSDRRSRLPANWGELVKKVWERDKGQCTWRLPKTGKRCPRPGRDVDHRTPGDDHRLTNLRLLCGHHHDKKTAMEGVFGRKKPRTKKREPERHPSRLR
jgi:5-methylcytosine-specific restriction endonuclease McrA